jgi:peroxiredoxin
MSDSLSVYQISKRKMLFLFLLGIVLVALNIALVLQNRSLKATAGNARGGRAIVLPQGKSLPTLSGLDTQGRQLSFDYGRDPRKTVLLVFSPHCSYCTDNMPNWNAITRGLDADAFRVVAVSTVSEGAEEYAAKHGLNNIPVITEPDPKNRVSYELNVTPQTVLIGADGTAEKVWTGLIQGDERDEIERQLGVTLPTLAAR